MVKTHREIFAELGSQVNAVLLDTPFGFQANADEIAQKASDYFWQSTQVRVRIASMRDVASATSLELETFSDQVSSADYVFAGPGSPTYALEQWKMCGIDTILAKKLNRSGVIAFSSAAVLTLGRYTIPIYEIYKAGHPVILKDGLDVLSSIGLKALVIPHFNNTEGQSHDTRFCYMGAHRLEVLISQMQDDTAVIGIDEHTGIVIDLVENTLKVVGLGTVTLMNQGKSEVLPTGRKISYSMFLEIIANLGGSYTTSNSPHRVDNDLSSIGFNPKPTTETLPLLVLTDELEHQFDLSLSKLDATSALTALLDLEKLLEDWRADTGQLNSVEKGRTVLRSMISRLSPNLTKGMISKESVLGPAIEALLELRAIARREKRWGDADLIRDRLDNLGVLVRDTPKGIEWFLKEHSEDD